MATIDQPAAHGELLKVERYDYDTAECRNIAIGKVILALERLPVRPEDRQAVLDFAGRQTGNSRGATAKKAAKFVAKMSRQTGKTLVS